MINKDKSSTDAIKEYIDPTFIGEAMKTVSEEERKNFVKRSGIAKENLEYFKEEYQNYAKESLESATVQKFFNFLRNRYLDEVMHTIIAAITFHALEYKDKDFKVERYKFDTLGEEFTLEGAFDWNINPFLILLIFCDTIHWFEREEYGEVAEIRHSPSEMYMKIQGDPPKTGETGHKVLFTFKIEYHFTNIILDDPERNAKDRYDVDFYINEMVRKFKTFKLETLPFGAHIRFIDTKNLRKKELSLNCPELGKIVPPKNWEKLCPPK